MSAPAEQALMPYPSAEHIARGVVLRLIGPEHLDPRVAAALLAELAARAERIAAAAIERAELVRELAAVTTERDAALLRLDEPPHGVELLGRAGVPVTHHSTGRTTR